MTICQILSFIFIIIIFLIFVFRQKIIFALNHIIIIIVLISFVFALTSIFFKYPFEFLADKTLSFAGVYNFVVEIDKKLPIEEIQDVLDSINNFWNNISGTEDFPTSNFSEVGFFESHFYTVLINLLSIIYRVFVFILSLSGMILGTYSSYNSSSIVKLHKLEQRIKVLEEERKRISPNIIPLDSGKNK